MYILYFQKHSKYKQNFFLLALLIYVHIKTYHLSWYRIPLETVKELYKFQTDLALKSEKSYLKPLI